MAKLRVSPQVAQNIIREEMAKTLGHRPSEWDSDNGKQFGAYQDGFFGGWHGATIEVTSSEVKTYSKSEGTKWADTEVAIQRASQKLRELRAIE